MSEGLFRRVGEGRVIAFGPTPLRVKAEGSETEDAFALVEGTLPPGFPGPPKHRHPWHESVYVLSGELEFTVGDQTIRAKRGDFVHAPAGVVHTYGNHGSEPSTVIGLFSPGRFLEAIEAIGTAFPSTGGPPDVERLREIYVKWGQEIVQ